MESAEVRPKGDEMSSEDSVLEYALKYAQLGRKVIPVTYPQSDGTCSCRKLECNAPGKHPAIKGWQDAATTDEAVIRKWFEADQNLNVGFITGDGLLLFDVDPRNGGDESLKALLEQIGPMPLTPEVRTGGGGSHFYFLCDGKAKSTASKTLKGLDTKGDGAFIVAPPSRHLSGNRYSWVPEKSILSVPIAPAPAGLLALLEKPKTNKSLVAGAAVSASSFAEGNRNNGLFKLGCSLQSKALDSSLIRTMLHLTNEAQCNPPLVDSEVDSIWKSCIEYAVESVSEEPIRYQEQNGRIIYNSQKGDEIKQITLSNFTARISEEKIIDDGLDQRTSFILTGRHQDGRQFPQVEISAEYFSGLSWVTKNWGSSAIVSPGFSTRDHLRAAIQELSLDKKQSTVFIHLGWRKIGDEYAFLHAGGAIGASGCRSDIAVDASEGKLKDFILPEPVTGSELNRVFPELNA
jgi:putative DNA primase/helicase